MNNQMLIDYLSLQKKADIQAREFERSEIIEELEKAKAKLEDYSQGLEKHLEECCPEE